MNVNVKLLIERNQKFFPPFLWITQDDERRDSIPEVPEEPENQQTNHVNHAKPMMQPLEEKRCRTTYERSHSLAEPLEKRQTNHFNENT